MCRCSKASPASSRRVARSLAARCRATPTSPSRRCCSRCCPALPQWRPRSGTRRCAIAAPSAARLAKNTPKPHNPGAASVGDPQVRNRGTIGGSIANNDPNADYPAAVLGLGATVITNKRRIAADDFFTGMFSTALEDGEIITKVSFPIAKKAAYEKFKHPASGFALVGVFVSKRGSEIRVAVTGAGANGVFRVKSFEEALKKRFAPKSLDGMTIPATGMNSDIHAGADYRAHLVSVLARRAVAKATA